MSAEPESVKKKTLDLSSRSGQNGFLPDYKGAAHFRIYYAADLTFIFVYIFVYMLKAFFLIKEII